MVVVVVRVAVLERVLELRQRLVDRAAKPVELREAGERADHRRDVRQQRIAGLEALGHRVEEPAVHVVGAERAERRVDVARATA